MHILRLKASNFYSFKKCELDFTKYSGIVYVKGKNHDTGGSNGSGKSLINEIISYSIHGKTLRKSTEEAMVNVDAKKSLTCEVEIEKEGIGRVFIRRGRKPTYLNFFVNGRDETQENAIKTQEKIEKVLGVDYKTFAASVVFGQHVDLDFLGASRDDKRTIIRNFLNLEDMFSLRDKIKDVKSEYFQGVKILTNVIDEINSQSIEINKKLTLVSSIEKVELLESFDEVRAREDKKKSFQEQKVVIKYEIDPLVIEIKKLEEEINKGVYSVKELCKTCKKSYIKKQTKANITRLKRKLSSAKKQLLKYTNIILGLNSKIEDIDSKLSTKKWVELNSKFEDYKKKVTLEQDYDNLLLRLRDKESQKHENEVNYEVMRFWEKAFSESGIIKYFVKNILDFLNFKTNEYLSILTHNQFSILFNDELDETITNNGRKLSYISLSGGEKRKINLAVMLALQTLLTHTSKEQSNIIFFDEVAENMDSDGCVGILNLLKTLKEEEKTIFLITHNPDLKKLLDGCQILTIEKKNGESKIK